MGLVAGQQLNELALRVQGVAGGGVLPGGVVLAGLPQHPHGVGRPRQHLLDVQAGHGQGEKPRRSEHRVPPADGGGDGEGGVARLVGQGPEGSLPSVRGGKNPVPGALPAVFFLQQPPEEEKGDGGLCGVAGFGDDIYGEVLVPHVVQQLGQGI